MSNQKRKEPQNSQTSSKVKHAVDGTVFRVGSAEEEGGEEEGNDGLVFEDPFGDEFEEEEFAEDADDDDEDGMEEPRKVQDDDGDENKEPAQVWRPGNC